MNLLDVFDRIYVINLPERVDRRRRIERELLSANVVLGTSRAIVFPAIRPDADDGFPSIAQRGALLSHMRIVEESLQAGVSKVLILEDDAVFTRYALAGGLEIIHELDSRPWHLAFLSNDEPPVAHAGPGWQEYDRPRRGFGVHCLALHGRVLEPLYGFMNAVATRPAGHPEGGRISADPTYEMFRLRHPGVITLMSRRSLAVQGSSRSDLAPKWFDGVHIVRRMLNVARDAKVKLLRP